MAAMAFVSLSMVYPLLLASSALFFHLWAGSFPPDDAASLRHQSGIAANLSLIFALVAANV